MPSGRYIQYSQDVDTMMFCPKCDNLLRVKKDKKNGGKKTISCTSCDFSDDFKDDRDRSSFIISEKMYRSSKDKTIVMTKTVKDDGITEDEREANEWLFDGSG
jgi:DNA-directed RNA polymerase subunit M/transcription elongation factor TFIIS